MELKIAVLAGDGIGPEISAEGVKVMKAVCSKFGHQVTFTEALCGAAAIDAVGNPFPEETLKACQDADAVLFSAVGDPRFDNNPNAKVRPEQGLLAMRKQLGLFANIRPVQTFDCLIHKSPLKDELVRGADFVCIRELTGGMYFGEKKEGDDYAYDTNAYSRHEVERILKTVNGVILLVDAAEGPMPQTRFVLQKALELGHKVIVAVNKIDKPDARVHEVMDEVLELLLDLNATDEQFNSPTVFCSGRQGTASYSPDEAGTDLTPLFETIVNYIPAPDGDDTAPLQLLVSSIDYNDYVGRIAVGRVERGTIKVNQEVTICDFHDANVKTKGKVVALYEFDGLSKNPVQEAHAGEIVALSGMADITIGRTLCAPECVEPLPFVKISDPTIEMTFAVNDSPFAGKEGKFVTSRNLRDRLEKELLKDVSLHVTEQGTDSFNVAGRGEMHLSILMETMRREGYEFSVSTPRVLTKEVDGKVCEPIERMVADVPEECMGSVIEKMGKRKGDLLGMTPMGSRYRLEFLVPSRGLFGYRNEFLTDTRGEGVMSSVLDSYAPMKGEIERRQVGSLVAFETGEAVAYGLAAAQERGALFIGPGTPVYAGMVVGVCSRNEDMTVNVCKKKQLTNMRAAGSDEALRLTPPRILSLEQCLEFLADDELLECTPKSLRIRKRELDHAARMRNLMKKRAQDNT